MKKLHFIFLLLTAGIIGEARAQIQKGTIYWGGTIGINGQAAKSEDYLVSSEFGKTALHSFSPELQWGKFVSNTVMLGVGARYTLQLGKNAYAPNGIDQKTIGHSISLLPFVRKYIPLGDRWAVFVHTEIGPNLNLIKTTEKGATSTVTKEDFWIYNLSVKPGLVYTFPNKKWSLEGYANVLSLNALYRPFKETSGRQFSLSTGISTNFPSYFSLRLARYISHQQ